MFFIPVNVNNNQQVANREAATLTAEGMLSSGACVGSSEGTSTSECEGHNMKICPIPTPFPSLSINRSHLKTTRRRNSESGEDLD